MNDQQRLWNSSFTGRAPRDMQSAFGCYTDSTLQPMREPTGYSVGWWLAFWIVSVTALVTVWVTR